MKLSNLSCIRICTLCLFGALTFSTTAKAQFNLDFFQEDAIGVGIWYGYGTISFDAAATDADNEVIGYSNVLPSSASGGGFALGVSYGSIGFNYGQDINEIEIDEYADVQQNDVGTDDVLVYSATRVNRSLSVLYQPLPHLYLGYGQDTGHFEFSQKTAAGKRETNKVPYQHNFYSIGLALGFDPTQSVIAPIMTAYIKIPVERSDFSGTVTGVGAGIYF